MQGKIENNFVCSFNTFLHCLARKRSYNDETFLCLDGRFVNRALEIYVAISQMQADFDFPTLCDWCSCDPDCYKDTAQE